MKKINFRFCVLALLVLVLVLGLVACGNIEEPKKDDQNQEQPPEDDNKQEDEYKPEDMVVQVVDNGKRKAKTISQLDSETFIAANFVSDLTFDYILLYAKDANGELYNNLFDYASYIDGKPYAECFYDNEDAKKSKEGVVNVLKQIKANFLNGKYEQYGYDGTEDFETFVMSFFTDVQKFECVSVSDVGIFFIYQDIMERYYNDVSNINNYDDIYFKLNYADSIDEYLYVNGYHVLICMMDDSGNIKYLEQYKDEDKVEAQKFYDLIYKVTKAIKDKTDLPDDKCLNEFCNLITNKFNAGDFTTVEDNLKYYLDLANVNISEFEEFSTCGFSLICEALEVYPGVMVPEFEAGVKEVWDSEIDKIIENNGKLEEEVVHEDSIITTFGYHMFVQTSATMDDLYLNGELLKLPSVAHDALFIHDYTKQETEGVGYVASFEYYVMYLEAKEKGGDELNKCLNKMMEFVKSLNVRALDNINLSNIEAEFIEKELRTYTNYDELCAKLDEGETIDLSKLAVSEKANAEVQYFFIPVANQYLGNYYYMYSLLLGVEDLVKTMELKDKADSVNEMVEYYKTQYQKQLTYLDNSRRDYNGGILEKLDKDLYDELMKYFDDTFGPKEVE